MSNFIKNIRDTFFFEKTKNIYSIPLKPETKIKNVLYEWPSHQGAFKGAVDLAVDLGIEVLSPLDGKVTEVIDIYDKYGKGQEFADYLNYITIAHTKGEYSQLAHIAKSSAKVSIGQYVKTGQVIGVTGLNGWMEEPFLEHLHMLVFKFLPDGSFKGLKIRFSEKPKEAKV